MENLSVDKKVTNLIDKKTKQQEAREYKSCLQLVGKMKQFVENPTIKSFTNISSIGNLLPRLRKEYNTDCAELSNFVNDFNRQNSSAKISVLAENVSDISSHVDEKNRKVEYSLFNFSGGDIY